MKPEKEVQNAIVDYFAKLKEQGIDNYVERRQPGGFAYKMGLPDLWATIYGKHVEIEVKQLDGKLRATQEKWKRKFIKTGAIYIHADEVRDVVIVLNQLRIKYTGGNDDTLQ